MDSVSAQDYFEILLDYQYDLLFVRQWGVNHTEFIFVQTAKVIQAHDNVRKSFFTQTENTLLSGYLIDSNIKTRPKGYIPDDFIWFLVRVGCNKPKRIAPTLIHSLTHHQIRHRILTPINRINPFIHPIVKYFQSLTDATSPCLTGL